MNERQKGADEIRTEQELQQARDIHSLASMPGWKTWLEWIAAGIENRRENLCVVDLDEKTSNRIRGEIALMRRLYYVATKVDAARVKELELQVKGLQIRADVLHDVQATTRSQQ